MNDYERELMANGTYLIRMQENYATPIIQMPPKHPVSPYAKFDKLHKKNRKRK